MRLITRYVITTVLLGSLVSCKENEQEPVTENKIKQDSLNAEPADTITNTYASVDISPMDMIYYPVDYPKLKMANNAIPPPVMRVIYSRPHLQGRKLFERILHYSEKWRLGANEATEIDFFRDVTIQDKKIKAGRYVLYCILHPDAWTMVINSNIDSWGLEQDMSKDVQRFDIPVTHGNPSLEYLTLVFAKTDTGAELVMAWDDVQAKLPIDFTY